MLNQILTTCISGIHITIYETMSDFQTQYGLSHESFKTLEALKFFYKSIDHCLTTNGLLECEKD